MRNKFADTLYEISKTNEKICALVADISPAGSMENFRNDYPARFINTGVAEQSMIGIAAGLAIEGFRPFCYTIATFALYRPFEFIRNYLHHEQIPVKLVGSGRNDDYGPCGFSHYACEDLKVLEALPNIEVYYPQTAEEVDIKKFLYSNKPSYINLRR